MSVEVSEVTAVPPDKIVLEARRMPAPEEVERLTTPYSLRFYLVPQLDSVTGGSPPIWTVAKDESSNEVLTVAQSGARVTDEEMDRAIFSRRPAISSADFRPKFRAVNQQGHVFLEFELKDDSTVNFAQIASRHDRMSLAIFLDRKLIAAPTMNGPIPAKGVIEGAFTAEEAQGLAEILNTGALPAPLAMTFAKSDK